jgi:hypothetical protein
MSKTTNRFSPEVRARAVRLVLDHEKDHPSRWAAVSSIAAKIHHPPGYPRLGPADRIGCLKAARLATAVFRRGPWAGTEHVDRDHCCWDRSR